MDESSGGSAAGSPGPGEADRAPVVGPAGDAEPAPVEGHSDDAAGPSRDTIQGSWGHLIVGVCLVGFIAAILLVVPGSMRPGLAYSLPFAALVASVGQSLLLLVVAPLWAPVAFAVLGPSLPVLGLLVWGVVRSLKRGGRAGLVPLMLALGVDLLPSSQLAGAVGGVAVDPTLFWVGLLVRVQLIGYLGWLYWSAGTPRVPPHPARRRWWLTVGIGLFAVVDGVVVWALSPLGQGGPLPGLSADRPRVVATIQVGRIPSVVVVDPTLHRAYVANAGDQSLSVIDTASNTVTATISDRSATHLAVDPTRHTLYLLSAEGLTVVDDDGRQIRAHVVFETESPDGVEVDPEEHTAFVTCDQVISVVDTLTYKVTRPIRVWESIQDVAVDQGTHVVYATHTTAVSVIDATKEYVSSTIEIGESARRVAVDATTHLLYVTHWDAVSVIDPAKGHLVATIQLGQRWADRDIAVDPAARAAYVTNQDSNTVTVIDTTTNTVTATVWVGKSPKAVAVDPDTHTAYIINSEDNTVSVIRAR